MATFRDSRWLPGVTCAATLLACTVLQPPIISLHAQDSMPTATDETHRTEAGVMAVDSHWSLAEISGDTAWLDQMLLPEYRSVNNDGTVHAKSAIVAGAAKHKGTSMAKAKQQFADYEKKHPYGSAVALHGNTAIVTFYDPALGPQKGVKSSDIFLYIHGRWHAMYSQHTAAR